MEMAIALPVARIGPASLAIPKQLLHNVARLPTRPLRRKYVRRTPKMPLPVMRFESHLWMGMPRQTPLVVLHVTIRPNMPQVTPVFLTLLPAQLEKSLAPP